MSSGQKTYYRKAFLKEQAVFVCQNCEFTDTADTNTARVIKKRGIQKLLNGSIPVKKRKSVMRLKKKEVVGHELAEATHVGEGRKTNRGYAHDPEPSMIREISTSTVLPV